MKKGIPVSPGVAVAPVFCFDSVLTRQEATQLDVSALASEVRRLEQAIAEVAAELDAIVERVSKQIGEEEASIFRAHRMLLRDPALIGKVKSGICKRHVDAVTALHDALDEYQELFTRIPNEYLQERMADIRDVISRLLTHLSLRQPSHRPHPNEAVIIVAPEILPSQALLFVAAPAIQSEQKNETPRQGIPVAGIITEAGGATSHAAILARALGIPAIAGVQGITREARTGDIVAMDGRDGHVHLNPGPEVEAAYRRLEREYVALSDQLIANRDEPAFSRDGEKVELLANVNNPGDAVLAARSGAVGVGLYRTEYLFLTHPTLPTEEEQLAVYRQVVEASPNRTVTIRTLDLGGDKQVPYFERHREANPFMGWRSIRLTTAYPEFFQTQLRAIYRASRFGNVEILFPMITTLEEVRQIKKMVAKTLDALSKTDEGPEQPVPLGIMIEVPAAALCIDTLLDEVDFVSIGSNDLTQYLMAADRDNPKVAHLCEPFSPALMRIMNHIIKCCRARNKPVTLCGEMAGRPRSMLPLFGMGLRRLSMSPGFVPSMKELIKRLDNKTAVEAADRVLTMRTVGEIRGYLTRTIKQIWPEVSLLDVRR